MISKIILASSSPYRQALLSRLQIPFTVFAPEIDETPLVNEPLQDLVVRLAIEKATVVNRLYPDAVCIGSDEVAGFDNFSVLGKPGNHINAVKQLQLMSGKKIFFYTGICVSHLALNHCESRLATTAVIFKTLTDTIIQNYLQKEKPYTSAGSFKSETLGSAIIKRFEGEDPTAIIGLPLIMLCDMLNNTGIDVLSYAI